MTECQELIISDLSRRGNGKTTPIRAITTVFSKDGEKLAEMDPHSLTLEDLMDIAERHFNTVERKEAFFETAAEVLGDIIPEVLYKER